MKHPFIDSELYRKTETEYSTAFHHENCSCALCGNRYHNIAFKGGYVCETCVDYIKGLV